MPLTIKDSCIVTGSRLVTNDFYTEHFKNKGKNIEHLLEDIIGRETRYICDNIYENTLTMGSSAVDKVLKESGLQGSDMDLIIFSSQYPEFTVPSQACIIHNHIKGKKKCVTLDLNVNCLGMLRGLDIANRYFNDKKGDFKYALLIGSDYMSVHTREDDAITFANFGDGACAVILEYTDDPNKGVIGCSDRTITEEVYGCMFPICGGSNVSSYSGDATKTSWSNPNISAIVECMKESLDDVLDKHRITIDEIDWMCASQFTVSLFEQSRKRCNIPKEKGIYVGNKYGYTGTSSPFFAFTEALNEGKIKSGDLVFFTSVGVGHTISSMLVRI